ncbi:hypothetical protein SAMN02800692_1649 [Luteibacter sp. UNC138MFCol5.1]|uniref:hypothetical protein n=1 Tax=Luteibacter sp. UNC138MFCol5.1 TaxID=1502774 RepID=UPI0008C70B35|nr:hypothetical protein [Luteibacter sp. UNC138MFCol5.1]SEO65874.1 hypothetical protein SAMN02800692_1649 [Luteibacter sp. UNC138MFCol5.1]
MDTYAFSDFSLVGNEFVLTRGDAMIKCNVFDHDAQRNFSFLGGRYLALKNTAGIGNIAELTFYGKDEEPVVTQAELKYISFTSSFLRMYTNDGSSEDSEDDDRLGVCAVKFSAPVGIKSITLDAWHEAPHLVLLESISVSWIENGARRSASPWAHSRVQSPRR